MAPDFSGIFANTKVNVGNLGGGGKNLAARKMIGASWGIWAV
jgi:hypothetical protein